MDQNDHAQLALPREGEAGNNHSIIVARLGIELSQKQSTMAELEWYKERCEKEGIGYYDSFKNRNVKDIDANLRRINLALFWDEIVEMYERHELPSDFKSQNKWINAGAAYRRLVEPLDIANYYLTSKDGNYLSEGRPNRHKVLQRWMEEKDQTRTPKARRPRTKPASLTQDSCFWAYVEEALKDLENLRQGQHQRLQNLQKFEEDVTRLKSAFVISSDVFLEGSSFTRWWDEWNEYKNGM